MSDLYFVRVEALSAARVDLRVVITHPDAEEFLEDPTFAHLLLADSLLVLSEKKAAKAPLSKLVPTGRGRASESVVRQIVKSARVRDVANLPDDLSEMSNWNDKRWRKRDSLPSATYEVTVTDGALLSHLTVGATWDSTAFTSEHVVEDEEAGAEERDEDVSPFEPEPEPLVLGKKNVFVTTPRELYGEGWAAIEKKKKLDPKWRDVPFAFMAAEKLMTLFTKANPEPPRSKSDEKEVGKVQLALTDRLDDGITPLVTNMEFYATHSTLSADAVRAFFVANGIDVLRLDPAVGR